jgi:hypothetical protein
MVAPSSTNSPTTFPSSDAVPVTQGNKNDLAGSAARRNDFTGEFSRDRLKRKRGTVNACVFDGKAGKDATAAGSPRAVAMLASRMQKAAWKKPDYVILRPTPGLTALTSRMYYAQSRTARGRRLN